MFSSSLKLTVSPHLSVGRLYYLIYRLPKNRRHSFFWFWCWVRSSSCSHQPRATWLKEAAICLTNGKCPQKVGHFALTALGHLDQFPTRAEQSQGLQGQSVQEWVAVSLTPQSIFLPLYGANVCRVCRVTALSIVCFCKQINSCPLTSEKELNSSITCFLHLSREACAMTRF